MLITIAIQHGETEIDIRKFETRLIQLSRGDLRRPAGEVGNETFDNPITLTLESQSANTKHIKHWVEVVANALELERIDGVSVERHG